MTVPLFVQLFSCPLMQEGPASPGGSYTPLEPVEELNHRVERAVLIQALQGKSIHFRSEAANLDSILRGYTECSVLHFTGHGVKGSLVLEDEYGCMQLVSEQELERMFSGKTHLPQVVFISACYSEGVSAAFVSAGVPHVIAVSQYDHVDDEKAQLFTKSFYSCLFRGDSVREAFDLACTRLQLSRDRKEEASKYRLLPEGASHMQRPFLGLSDHVGGNFVCDITPPLPPSNAWEVAQYFLGRECEVQQVVRHLACGSRAITVVGRPGVGKTQVVLKACQYARERRMIGEIRFVSMGASRHFRAISNALGIATPIGPRAAEALMTEIVKWCSDDSKTYLLVLDGCLPSVFQGKTRCAALSAFVERLLQKAPSTLRVIMTIVQQAGVHGEKVVAVGPLTPFKSAELLYRSAPRPLKEAELTGGLTSALDEPLRVFSRGEVVCCLQGNTAAIVEVAKYLVEDYNLLENEDVLLRDIIPDKLSALDLAEEDFIRELEACEEQLRHFNSDFRLTRLSSSEEVEASKPQFFDFKDIAQETNAMHRSVSITEGFARAHPPAEGDGSNEIRSVPLAPLRSCRVSTQVTAVEKETAFDAMMQYSYQEVVGEEIWNAVQRKVKPVPKSRSNTSLDSIASSSSGGRPPPTWSELCRFGLCPYFARHLGTERPLCDEDLDYMKSCEQLWSPSPPPSAHPSAVCVRDAFITTFWPWFSTAVKTLRAIRLWPSRQPLYICGFSNVQAHKCLAKQPLGTFTLRVSSSRPGAIVICCVDQAKHVKLVQIHTTLAAGGGNNGSSESISFELNMGGQIRHYEDLGQLVNSIPMLKLVLPGVPKEVAEW